MDIEESPPDLPPELPSDPPRTVAARASAWLHASPVEVVGLAVLLLGALTVTALVAWDGWRRPSELPPAASVGTTVDQPSEGDGADPGHPAPAPGNRAAPDASAEAPDDAEVVVHVSGAVHAGGVVTLAAGSRVTDAIAAAGGTTGDADTDRLNLARVLVDGEQVHVPVEGEAVPDPANPGEGGATGPDGRIDLNRATQEDLETLPGIGPAKASAILDHRESVGAFEAPGDLREVPGIGERTFQQLADLVTVR